MKPYEFATGKRFNAPYAGQFFVPVQPAGATRPNRTAAGMTATHGRKERRTSRKQPYSEDALRLMVRGTLDSLHGYRFDLERVVCPCCGERTQRLKLRPGAAKSRRLKLARLKRQRLKSARRLP
jgi:hypothetical protein